MVYKCYLWEDGHIEVRPDFGELYFKPIPWQIARCIS